MESIDEHATALADAIEAALPGWVERSVRLRLGGPTGQVETAAAEAGRQAASEVGGAVRRLLEADIDEQATTPLALLRGAVRYPTAVLRAAGVAPVPRDAVQERLFPDDVYDLAPASFADIDPSLLEPGIRWGAAKAFVHKQRHGGGAPAMPERKKVVAYVPDLMDRSKVASSPADVTFVNRPADLAAKAAEMEADLIVVDLTRPGVVDQLPALRGPNAETGLRGPNAAPALGATVIGFANHTNREAMDAALAAGADQVMARSAFFARLDDLLGGG
ncbi:MAG TPA: hypothetical protein VF045_03360 [Acidimicrobiales bacterium]